MPHSTQSVTRRDELQQRLDAHGQGHVLRFWAKLTPEEQAQLAAQIDSLDLPLIDRLVKEWIVGHPQGQSFTAIEPLDVLPVPTPGDAKAQAALSAGETALRAGRVGM